MSDEPAAKRSKDEEEAHEDLFALLDSAQIEFDALNEKASEEILEVEKRFNVLRKPVLDKRRELTQRVKSFWPTALMNHPQLSTFIADAEEPLIGAIADITVEDFADIKSGFIIRVAFLPNDYLESEFIEKQHFLGDNPHVTVSSVRWKRSVLDVVAQNKHPVSADQQTFFEWLTDAGTDPTIDEVGEIIKDDLWTNPVQYFLLPEVIDDEEEADIENQ